MPKIRTILARKKKLHFLLHFLQRTMAAGGKEEGMRLHS